MVCFLELACRSLSRRLKTQRLSGLKRIGREQSNFEWLILISESRFSVLFNSKSNIELLILGVLLILSEKIRCHLFRDVFHARLPFHSRIESDNRAIFKCAVVKSTASATATFSLSAISVAARDALVIHLPSVAGFKSMVLTGYSRR